MTQGENKSHKVRDGDKKSLQNMEERFRRTQAITWHFDDQQTTPPFPNWTVPDLTPLGDLRMCLLPATIEMHPKRESKTSKALL